MKHLKTLLIATALVTGLSTNAFAQTTSPAEMPSGLYTVDDTHTSVTWKVSHMGLSNYTARFTKVDAQLTFDAAKPEHSKVVATIDPMSIRTDFPYPEKKDFDKELATGKEWFNAAAFPKITFESTNIERVGEAGAKIHGNMTLLGMKKPVILDAQFNGAYIKKPFADVPSLGFSGKAVIKRSEFGFSTYVPMIGDEVEVLIEVEFHQANPVAPDAPNQ